MLRIARLIVCRAGTERWQATMVCAGVLPVTLADFEEALEEEPSDYDAEVAKRNRDFNQKHGWRQKCRIVFM